MNIRDGMLLQDMIPCTYAEHVIYVLHDPIHNLYKIGRTRRFTKRLYELKGQYNPSLYVVALFEYNYDLETRLHNRLRKYRIDRHPDWPAGAREWFRPSRELWALLQWSRDPSWREPIRECSFGEFDPQFVQNLREKVFFRGAGTPPPTTD